MTALEAVVRVKKLRTQLGLRPQGSGSLFALGWNTSTLMILSRRIRLALAARGIVDTATSQCLALPGLHGAPQLRGLTLVARMTTTATAPGPQAPMARVGVGMVFPLSVAELGRSLNCQVPTAAWLA